MAEAIAVASGLDDVTVMRETVVRNRGHFSVTEHFQT